MRMKLLFCVWGALFLCVLLGCAGSNAIIPTESPQLTASAEVRSDSQTHLWGFYDVAVDLATMKVTAIMNRHAMYTANVVTFMNSNTPKMMFNINSTDIEPEYIDIDIDVTLEHPFPGLTQYNGYDVRGVFMGNGSGSLTSAGVSYPVLGEDQFMMADPKDGIGRPDGFTRWFNCKEFSKGGLDIFQYTKGKLATPGYEPSATLCSYKYFADGLGNNEDLWDWLNDPGNSNKVSVFSAGHANSRNYYIRFPNSTGVKFAYAIIANWEGEDPQYHPSNAPEAVCADVDQSGSTVFYVGPDEKGGDLVLNISLWDWDSIVNSVGAMDDYRIIVESTVLSNPHECSPVEMTPIGGGEHSSTYHVDIPADNVHGTQGNEYWLIVQCADKDYSNEFGQMNDAWSEPLAAFFRFDLIVSNTNPNLLPVAVAAVEKVCGLTVDLSGAGSYDPDGTIVKYEWDWENDGTFDEEGMEISHDFPSISTFYIQLRVTDNNGATDILDSPLQVVTQEMHGWALTWGGPSYDYSGFSAIDNQKNIYVVGTYKFGPADFDPDPVGQELHTTYGQEDPYVSKFDATGDFQWVRTWGSTDYEEGRDVAVDSAGNVYVAAYYRNTVDFDPGPGTDTHISLGDRDVSLSKFDTSGNFLWARTWGGIGEDCARSIVVDNSDNVYMVGYFSNTVDFDPDPVTEEVRTSVGGYDAFFCKYAPDGTFQWAKTWGGILGDDVNRIVRDKDGNFYLPGAFRDTVDLDPGLGVDSRTAVGDCDAYLLKFDSGADYLWGRTWGDAGADNCYGVYVNSYGIVGVSGQFAGTVDFDPGAGVDSHASNGQFDSYLARFDTDGNFVWAVTWGGVWADAAHQVAVDSTGNIYVTGNFYYTVDFDPGPGERVYTSAGLYDAYFSKFDSSGNFLRINVWGRSGDDDCYGITFDECENPIVNGHFTGTIDFNPGSDVDNHTSAGACDALLVKYLPNGYWD